MTKSNHPAAARENVLIGLTLVEKLFSPTPAQDIAQDANEAYDNDAYQLTTSMLSAALMIIQEYAQRSGEPISDTVADLRQRILSEDIDLPPLP